MARNTDAPVRQYRGTTDQHASYAGPIGEITVDVTKPTAVVQDGSLGGHPLALEERTITAADSAIVLKVGDEQKTSVDLSQNFTIGLDIEGLASEMVDEIVKDMVSEKLEGSLISDDDEILGTDDDGKINTTLCIEYTEGTGKFALTGKGGAEICSVTVPSATSMLSGIGLTNEDGEGNPGYYLHCTFKLDDGSTQETYIDLNALFNPVSAGNGITLSEENEISVNISEDGGLVFEDDGSLAVDSSKLGCAMIYEATEDTAGNLNQIQCMEDKLYVPTDYGTMDDQQ